MDTTKASPQTPIPKTRWRTFVYSLLLLLILTQIQPLVILSLGGIGGSFGIRPISHRCLGIQTAPNPTIDRLPEADIDFRLGLFHFQYTVHSGYTNTSRQFCLGQDIWFGD